MLLSFEVRKCKEESAERVLVKPFFLAFSYADMVTAMEQLASEVHE